MFDTGDRVEENDHEEGKTPRLGTVLQWIEDGGFYCSDPSCCGEPSHTVVVRWDDGEEERLAEWQVCSV
jgi:hypothetical protein